MFGKKSDLVPRQPVNSPAASIDFTAFFPSKLLYENIRQLQIMWLCTISFSIIKLIILSFYLYRKKQE